LEQGSLYDKIRFADFPFPHSMPGEWNLNGQKVDMFHCPSYPLTTEPLEYTDTTGVNHYAHTHYLGVNGTDQFGYDGILHVNSRVKIEDVKDGASNTLLAGERPPTYDRYAGWWLAGSGFFPWFGAADVVLGTNERIAVAGESTPTGPTSHYQRGVFSFEDDGYGWDKHAWHFWSAHDGGAFFLFADGHVKFIPYGVSSDIFRNLGTYKGGEANNGQF
jgi:prepilin-type processing-associated H-X9-DG protein